MNPDVTEPSETAARAQVFLDAATLAEWHDTGASAAAALRVMARVVEQADAAAPVPAVPAEPTEDDWREAAKVYEDDPGLLVGLAAPAPAPPAETREAAAARIVSRWVADGFILGDDPDALNAAHDMALIALSAPPAPTEGQRPSLAAEIASFGQSGHLHIDRRPAAPTEGEVD